MNGIIDSNQKIVSNGLVLNYDAAQLRSYSGSGTTWTDISATGNNGTLTNGPTFNSGNGGSIVFDGTNDFVNCGIPLTFTNSFTVSYFFKSTSTPTVVIMGMYNGVAGSPYWWTGIVGPPNKINFSFGSPSVVDLASTSTITNGVWIQATCVYDKSINSTFLYFNSILESSSSSIPSTVLPPLGNLNMGKFGSLGFYYSGNISNAQIYNRALSQTEITQNYNAIKSRFGI